jgi:hypothetical protein
MGRTRPLPAVLCSLVFAAAAPTNSVVRLDAALAPELAGTHVATLRQAVRAFGTPDRVLPAAGSRPLCRASWQRLGLEIRFSTAKAGACSVSDMRSWWQVTMRAARWHTRLGLGVGDGERDLHSRYPNARRLDFLGLGALWELETGGPLCDGGPPLALAARVVSGRVGALLVVHVPACG